MEKKNSLLWLYHTLIWAIASGILGFHHPEVPLPFWCQTRTSPSPLDQGHQGRVWFLLRKYTSLFSWAGGEEGERPGSLSIQFIVLSPKFLTLPLTQPQMVLVTLSQGACPFWKGHQKASGCHPLPWCPQQLPLCHHLPPSDTSITHSYLVSTPLWPYKCIDSFSVFCCNFSAITAVVVINT